MYTNCVWIIIDTRSHLIFLIYIILTDRFKRANIHVVYTTIFNECVTLLYISSHYDFDIFTVRYIATHTCLVFVVAVMYLGVLVNFRLFTPGGIRTHDHLYSNSA